MTGSIYLVGLAGTYAALYWSVFATDTANLIATLF